MSKMKPTITLVVLSALFCLSHSQDPTESNRPYIDVTSSMSSFQAQYKYPPKVVTIRNQIYTVYVKTHVSPLLNDTFELLLTSLDSGNQRQHIKSCDLSLPKDSLTITEIDKVVALGNGKIVITSNNQLGDGLKDWIYHIIIDPFDCSTQRTIKVTLTKIGQVVLALVPYYDSYDIFYTYYTIESTGLPNNPYRYNDEAQRVELDYHLETHPIYDSRFQINTIKPFNASEGYYHTYLDEGNNEIVLQRLDSRFQKVKEIRLKDTAAYIVTDISTTQGHINYCSLQIEKPFCKLLNADLEVQFTSQLPKLNFPTDGFVAEHKVINLPNNKGLVVLLGYQHSHDLDEFYRPAYDFYLQLVGSDGSVGKTRKIESLVRKGKDDYAIVDSSRDFCHVTFSSDYDWVFAYKRCLDL